ncbi:MAG: pentapeptide repeat-containing protein [Sulfurovum sp.]|nr:pentapeptide repeat-containing protein [Sulfurovum sp.]MCB4763636.1 pentapeptide repeat-containing protein [Sulfurovum sp.]
MTQCSYKGCGFECYENHDKCIFHYDKEDWLTPKTKVWKSDSEKKIKFFWTEIRQLKDQIKNQYIGFIFPRFEEFTESIDLENSGKIQIGNYKYIDNIYFGNVNSSRSYWYYAFLHYSNFLNVKFMDVADFSKISLEGNTNFKNVVFEKGIRFSWETLQNITFDDVEFKEDISFDGFQINSCKFINTDFKNKITFLESKFSDISFENSKFHEIMDFSSNNFSNNTNFKQVIFFKKANFENGVFGSSADFSQSSFEEDAVFTQREFRGNTDFSKATIKGKALFDVNNIQGKANFSEVRFEDESTFKNVEISGDVNFLKATLKGKANFENGVFGSSADFSQSSFEDEVNFKNGVFKNYVNFSKVISNNLIFDGSKFIESDNEDEIYDLKFNNGEYKKNSFKNVTMDIDIISKNSKFEAIIFENFKLSRFSELEFRQLEIEEMTFDKYINESEKVIFDFVTVDKKLKIKHVSFDQERFNHFDMSKADIEIENSAFNDNFFNSVKWGTISEKRYIASRDIFRQLKFYSEQQKNFIDADGFYSLEMKERKKELQEESKKLNGFDKISHFFTDTMVFFIHEKTSDFSQSWILPIYWLFMLGMIGVIYKNFEQLNMKTIAPYMIVISILLIFIPYAYKNIMQVEKLPKWLLYLCISIPIVSLYTSVTTDYLDDIAKIVNPSNIFKPMLEQKKEENQKVFEFGYLMFKIGILFLVYQVIIAMKKKVRSK